MKYLCLVYFEPQVLTDLSLADKMTLDRDSLDYDDELRRSGHYIDSNALQPVTAARTVRMRRSRKIVNDGPFAETREHLGGFILIEASSMDEAVEIAAKIPLAKLGSIEVRPTMVVERPDA